MADVTLTRTTTDPVRPGDTVTYELRTSSDFPDFNGFGGRVRYDGDELTFVSFEVNSSLNFQPNLPDVPEDATGIIESGTIRASYFNVADLGGTIDGRNVTVITLEFVAKAAGDAEISFIKATEPIFSSGLTSLVDEPITTSLTVVPLATPLAAQGDSATVAEDTSIEIDVLANDGDRDGLTIQTFTNGANGAVTQTAGGLTYAPTLNYNGPDSFTYDVTDNDETQTVTVNVTVTPVNDAPVATDDGATVVAGGSVAVDVLDNDDDADGDALTVTAASGASNGLVAFTPQGVTYTPAAGFTGTDRFTYDVSDGQGGTDTATVDVTVTPVPVSPTGTVSLVPSNTGFLRPNETVSFALTTAPDFPMFDSFEAFLTYDASALEYKGAVFSSIFDTSSGQAASAPPPPTDAEGEITLDGLFTGTAFTGDPAGGETVVTLTFEARTAGTAEISLEGSDNGFFFFGGGTPILVDPVSAQVEVNSLPTATADAAVVAEDASVVIDVLDNDDDVDAGDMLSIADVTQGSNGKVEVTTGGLLYTPKADFAGTDTFTYSVFDGKETVQATVTVDVTAVNDAPIALPGAATVAEDGTITIDLNDLVSDVDGPSLTFTVGEVSSGTTTILNGVVTYTPAGDYNGPASFDYTVSDGEFTATATVDVTVEAVNDRPVAVADTLELDENTSMDVDVLANDTDVDGDTLSVKSVNPGTNGSVSLVGGVVTYTPNEGYVGEDSFTYVVQDGEGGEATATVAVLVRGVNDDPVAAADAFTLAEDAAPTLLDVLANDADPDAGDVLSVASVTGATGGTAAVAADGSGVIFTPDADFAGTGSFEYTVADDKGGTATATATVTVEAVNDAPILAVGDAFEFVEGADGAVFTPTASDVDSATLRFSLSGDDAGLFAIDDETGVVTFREAPSFTGDEKALDLDVTVMVSDGELSDSRDVGVRFLRDSDGDRVADLADNAIFAFNPDQRDSNGDGYGNVIDADLNGDGTVSGSDGSILRSYLFQGGFQDGVDEGADADFNGDGTVDFADVDIFVSLIGLNLEGQSSADFFG